MKQYKNHARCLYQNVSYEGTSSTNDETINRYQSGSYGRSGHHEDIVDTGNTLVELKELFKKTKKHFKIATLFFKPEAYTKDIKIDYIGIRIK
jgi:hypoxanthine phosphoribosyltransferase